ncbi:MAG: beta-lactamase domain protein [Bryobacterales bacterium]|nr:beta-lactamase domain protein [Bryobacterales bacterium]
MFTLGCTGRCACAEAQWLANCKTSFMDKVTIPEADVIAFDSLAQDVTGLRILMVNIYAIKQGSGEWMLIDCGLPHAEGRIRDWAAQHFGAGNAPQSILLTHGHFDHAGSVEALAESWNVPVYVHPLELPYVTGTSPYPPPDPSVGGGLMARLSGLYPRSPVDISSRVKVLPDSGAVPGFAAWRWIHTPGHTDGHVSLFRDFDRTLIAGDAFCTTKQESFLAVATQKPEMHGPPAYYTTDWDAARDSVQRLAALRPNSMGPGHGQPLAGLDAANALTELARNFDAIARPAHGKYVDQPTA